MVTGTFGLGVLIGGLFLALIGIRSGVLLLAVPAVVAIIWFSTTTEIRQVTVEGNQKDSGVHVATPWGEPTYSYGGGVSHSHGLRGGGGQSDRRL